MHAFVEGAHVVGPHAGRVDDGARPNRGLVATGADPRADDAAAVPFERHDFGVVHRDGAVRDGGPRDRERESSVVGVRVVVARTRS